VEIAKETKESRMTAELTLMKHFLLPVAQLRACGRTENPYALSTASFMICALG